MWLIQEELGEIEEQLHKKLKMEIKDKITDFTEKLEKLMAENEDLKNKLEVS